MDLLAIVLELCTYIARSSIIKYLIPMLDAVNMCTVGVQVVDGGCSGKWVYCLVGDNGGGEGIAGW